MKEQISSLEGAKVIQGLTVGLPIYKDIPTKCKSKEDAPKGNRTGEYGVQNEGITSTAEY